MVRWFKNFFLVNKITKIIKENSSVYNFLNFIIKETKNKDDDSSSVHSELLNQSLEDVSESKSNAKKTRPRTRKSLGHLAYERGQQNDDANDDASSVCSSVCSELLENKEEDVPLAKKTRSRTSRKSLGPAVDKESAVKAKTTRSGSGEFFKF